MKKIFTLACCALLAISASALTLDDLTGVYELRDSYGYTSQVVDDVTRYFGSHPKASAENDQYINDIRITTDGYYLYITNFMGCTIYAEVDFAAGTVTIPVQEVDCPSGYYFTVCKYDSNMRSDAETPFTLDDAQPIVMPIGEDGDFSTIGTRKEYICWYGWGYCYGFICGTFHKTSDFLPDDDTASILGAYTCSEFYGDWNYIWSDEVEEDHENWFTFDINSGDGVSDILIATSGSFPVQIRTLGGNGVFVTGLWWGYFNIYGYYDASTATITFPLQTVWDGYTLCNSSMCDLEVATTADVVPATGVVNSDGSISLHYTLEYDMFPYLYTEQTISRSEVGIPGVTASPSEQAPRYYTIQGIPVAAPSAPGLYIVVSGTTATKQLVK